MQLLQIRFFQLRRDLGFWTLIIAVFVFFVVKGIVSEKSQYAWYICALATFGLYQHYLQRKDLVFAKSFFRNSRWQIVFNYNLTLLPCTAAFLVTGNFFPAVLMHLLASALPWLRFDLNGPSLLFLGRYIPATHFEWISGLRKHGIILLILLLLAIILSPVKLFGIGALFLLNLSFIGFYNFFEPLIMLNPHHLPLRKFLNEKVRYILRMILLTNLPLLLVNCIFHPGVILINTAFLISFLLLAANAVLIKYANYRPGETLSVSGDLLVLVAAVFVPYLIPVALMLYFVNLKKASTQLLQYTDDDPS